MGLFRGAVFRHGRGARKQPIKQPTELPTSTMALMGLFPSLVGRFPTLMGRFPRFYPKGPLCLLKIHWKTAHEEKGHQEVLERGKRQRLGRMAVGGWDFVTKENHLFLIVSVFVLLLTLLCLLRLSVLFSLPG